MRVSQKHGRRLWWGVLLVMGSVLFALPAGGLAAPDLAALGFEEVAQNDYLTLYVDPETMNVAVRDQGSDHVWYTNPADLRQERVARGEALDRLQSQLYISYFSPRATYVEAQNHRNSFSDAVEYSQVEYMLLDDGVRVEYTFNRMWRDRDFLPRFITAEGFEALMDRMESAADEALFRDCFLKVTMVPVSELEPQITIQSGLEEEDVIGPDHILRPLNDDYVALLTEAKELQAKLEELSGATGREAEERREALEAELSSVQSSMNSERRSTARLVVNRFVTSRVDISAPSGIKPDYFTGMIDQPTYVLKDVFMFDEDDMIEINQQIGYTPENVGEEHAIYNLDIPRENEAVFLIPLEYRLDGADLIVRIPTEEIEYPIDIIDERGRELTYPLHTITLLPQFGAAHLDETDGYIFVPDGSGALIELSNNRLHASAYNARVYGSDPAMSDGRRLGEGRLRAHSEHVRLPVFGLKEGDKAFFAVIEEGDAMATLRADIAGRGNSYNTVGTQFTFLPQGRTGLGDSVGSAGVGVSQTTREGQVNIYQARPYNQDIRVRYSFLHGDEANYVGMAHTYQAYLENRYGWERQNPSDRVPFVIDLIGALPLTRVVLGITREIMHPMTTFEQAASILSEAADKGLTDPHVRLSGWMPGGLHAYYPARARPERVLGGESGFEALITAAAANGATLYPDVPMMLVHKTSAFDGFRPNQHAARLMNRMLGRTYTRELASISYILSPNRLPALVDSFLSNYARFELDAVSLSDMGTQLHSDFRTDPELLVDRQQALQIIRGQAERIGSEGYQTMLSGGNAQIIPYTDIFVDLPTQSTEYVIFNHSVPFLQIVLRGYADYAGRPVNFSQETDYALLKAIETGAGLYYRWTYEDSSLLKTTDFSHLFSLNYRYWLDEAAAKYTEVDEALRHLAGQRIIGHQPLRENVFQTTFEDGTKVIVNYTYETVPVDIYIVPARDYKVILPGGEIL